MFVFNFKECGHLDSRLVPHYTGHAGGLALTKVFVIGN